MADKSSLVGVLQGQNAGARKREFNNSGAVAKTFGINVFELGQYVVLKKRVNALEDGKVIVSGEALQENANGKVELVSDGPAKYVAIEPNEVFFDKKFSGADNAVVSIVAEEADQEVYVLKLEADKRVVLSMKVNEAVVEGDELGFDTTYGLKKVSSDAVFKVVEGAEAGNVAKVVRI